MISYITSFFHYLFLQDNDDDEDHVDDINKEAFLADQLVELQTCNTTENAVTEPKCEILEEHEQSPEIPRNAVCFQRTGVIKYIDDKCVMIDGTIYFDISTCTMDLNLQDRILYLGYNNPEGKMVIVRILVNYGIAWGEEHVEETSYDVKEHIIVGEVSHRDNRLVFIKDGSLNFNLDSVHSEFVPVKGDWLEMTCSIKYDKDKPSEMSIEQVLQVISIKPLRKKIKSTTITEWTGEYGICDRQMFFDKECVSNNTMLKVGTKALVEAIESSQGTCTWRVIKMDIYDTKITESVEVAEENEEDKSLIVEQKHNIEVTYPLKFEKINIQNKSHLTLSVTNNGDETQTINKWVVLSKKRDSQVEISPFLTRPTRLYPGQTFSLKINCNPKFYGNSKEHLIIMFRGFQVRRIIQINIVEDIVPTPSQTAFHNIKTNEQQKKDSMKKILQKGNGSYILGQKVIRTPNFIPVRLGSFTIPDKVWAAVLGDSEQTIYSEDYYKIINRIETKLPCLLNTLNITNYTDIWHTLLYMEEIQQNINMRSYDMPKVFLIRFQEYLGLEIHGLAEKRPSLIKGDRAIVRDVWDNSGTAYEGYIHLIKGEIVLMKFHPKFHEAYSGSDVSIEFHFSRSVYRRAHQAINLTISNLGVDILFPARVFSRPFQIPVDRLQDIQWFNKNLNARQKTSVCNILIGEYRPMPYCIYGPPGTGKTVTVIETVLQILTHFPDSRILIATPSNSAANLVAERLLQYKDAFSTSLIRLIANYLLDSENIPEVIKPYCATIDIAAENSVKSRYTVKDGINLNCPASFIGRHRVTIGTCFCLGNLAQVGLPKGHFTHVVVDEAGQATEPEIMIPLTFVDKENSQIILAGDPMQLGPVIMSRYSMEYGMDESFLSRLLDSVPYQKDLIGFKDGFNEKLVSRLTDNYRSLQEVIDLSSEMFYDSSLVAKIDRNQPWIRNFVDVVTDVFGLNENPKSGGVVVYGIRGTNSRGEDSPSWFNPQEAYMVALTTCKLFKRNVTADDIGIITPYIAQIKYIRLLFDAMGLPQPKIGTVEEFQGQERPIIIISTVRSTETLLVEDQKHSLGFVQSPKRLNVALTRAQVATLLFCDPHLLANDPRWFKVIKSAVDKDKYLGCDLPLSCQTNMSGSNVET